VFLPEVVVAALARGAPAEAQSAFARSQARRRRATSAIPRRLHSGRAEVVCFHILRLKAATMGWFRSNSGRVAGLAFFALACQLVFTFGHVHVGNVGVIRALAISTVAADAANDSAGAPFWPPQKTPTGLAQDFCAICNNINNISLANTLVLPLSPAILPPISIVQELQWPLVAIGLASRDHFYFNARGPPHA
jgi:hypothetical protein